MIHLYEAEGGGRVLCSASSGVSIYFGFEVSAPFGSRVERSVFKHHQTSLMSQLGGTSSVFRYKTDVFSLKGIAFLPAAAKRRRFRNKRLLEGRAPCSLNHQQLFVHHLSWIIPPKSTIELCSERRHLEIWPRRRPSATRRRRDYSVSCLSVTCCDSSGSPQNPVVRCEDSCAASDT